MITELFVNSCFTLTLNKNTLVKKNKALFRDILDIITFYKKNEKDDIPINVKTKLECLETVCELKLEDKLSENIIDSILIGEKFRNLEDFLVSKINNEYNEAEISDGITQVRTRKKMMSLLYNYKDLSKFVDTVKNGTFTNPEKLLSEYDSYVKSLYSSLMESSRIVEQEASASLDILKDDYTNVIDLIKQKNNIMNILPTGFDVLDNNVLRNGLEQSRLYIFGGGSGSGKSTLMLNIITNDLNRAREISEEDDGEKTKVHLYITLENSIDESFQRMYQIMHDKTDIQFFRDINSLVDTDQSKFIKKGVVDKIVRKNTTVIFKYYPKFSISPTDIMMIIDDVESEYGKGCLRGVYVDYLDLLRLDTIKYDQYRLELSHLTSNLKDIAVAYCVPLVTVTQLTRGVYEGNKEAKELSLAMMSEAIKKVDHADFVALMVKDKLFNKVHMNVGKVRNGVGNVNIDFNIDFSKYKFLIGYLCTNNTKKEDDITSSGREYLGFSGVGNLDNSKEIVVF